MSYADASVDLTPINVACLSGPNGAGKSALLDAVTWCLWEQARSSSDEIMRLGQKEMWVELTFALETRTYRVRRARQRSGRGASRGSLDLQLASSAPGERAWRSLTAPTMRETQKKICELLRMDFDTFINSVYLRQGKADEFTTRAPAERKQVLCEILGLSYFDRLQELSRERSRQVKAKMELLEAGISRLPEMEQRLITIGEELDGVRASSRQCAEKLQFCENASSAAAARIQDLRLTGQRAQAAEARLAELQADIAEAAGREAELLLRLNDMAGMIERAAEIEAAAAAFERLKQRVEALDDSGLQFQDLSSRRLELQSELAAVRSKLEVEHDHFSARLAALEGMRADLMKDTSERAKLESSYRQLKELMAREAELSRQQEAYNQLLTRKDDLTARITEARIRLEAEIQQKQGALSELATILAGEPALAAEKARLNEEAELLDRLESQLELVEEKGLRVKSDLEALGRRIPELRRRQEENQQKVKELEEHSNSSICPLCSAPIVDRQAVITRYLKDNEAAERQIAELETSIAQLECQRQDLRKNYLELRRRLDTRKELDARIGQLREKCAATSRARQSYQQLQEGLKILVEKLENQEYAPVERESLVNVKAEIHKLDFDPVLYANLQAQIRAMRHVEGRFHQLQKELSELKKVEKEIPEIKARLDDVANQLASETYGSHIRDQLLEIQRQLEALDYNRQEHQQLKTDLAALIPVSAQMRDLERARGDKRLHEEELASLGQSLERKKDQLRQLSDDLVVWKAELEELPEAESALAEIEPVLGAWRAEKESLAARMAVLEAQLDQTSGELKTLESDKQELAQAHAELSDYLFLSEAFGKKGIQAVIIENAVPEIESEANYILSKLSDNQMHVALATQHKTKAGTTVETLDLLIGDELGTRSYELYSGGEAFKVDFAVRVALSRLLARRAGAKLETLIIDEGFGSQDELSRERIVGAINSIKEDFARILVITHISGVKDMFPVQIQVSKVGGASTVSVCM
jgi:exonuclease SbcC